MKRLVKGNIEVESVKMQCMVLVGVVMLVFLSLCPFPFGTCMAAGPQGDPRYELWKAVGEEAAARALTMIMKKTRHAPVRKHLIVLTNAGYAEVRAESTMAALDGLGHVTKASRGSLTLLEIHALPESPLWFAVFDRKSGYCAYLQVDPDEVSRHGQRLGIRPLKLFGICSIERIDAAYLFKNRGKWPMNFGGNTFRIVTIANSVAAGAPAYAVRAFEFHDHDCPGVTSGILMASFAKRYFAESGSGSYFVQGLQPWCKEDALLVMLNATPGKSGYGVTYPGDGTGAWPELYRNAHNIIYHHNENTNLWEGVVLQFVWGDTSHCNVYKDAKGVDKGGISKLCMDLWYLNHMNAPENFVKPLYKFTLKEGDHPRNYARVGLDIMQNLPLGEETR